MVNKMAKKTKKQLIEEIQQLVGKISVRKGKSVCSDTVYGVAKGLLQPVKIVKPGPGKTKEQAEIEALEARLIVAKKLAGITK